MSSKTLDHGHLVSECFLDVVALIQMLSAYLIRYPHHLKLLIITKEKHRMLIKFIISMPFPFVAFQWHLGSLYSFEHMPLSECKRDPLVGANNLTNNL